MSDHEVVLGKIVGVFGVKGWVKVQSFSSPIENIFSYKSWVLEFPDSSRKQSKLREGKRQGKGLVASLEGVADRDEARMLVGSVIKVAIDQLPELEQGDFYWYQLEGLEVSTVQGEKLGVVDHLMETGSNDVMVVKPTQDGIDERERLIPYLPGQVVQNVELEKRLITVDWDPDF
ncbi:ribosome maturation factor RimM [Hahella sp. CCB-MM4]|uniref:ribosome maturation factor RimM n=1 Tax=Hahella sp. (strain CCB-MM4) TaxID=1926491 RepID=UPI000B9BA8B0|nr:ribosome maturation factor RimM [Hahella sp. CCB-MM4]OZG70645.1 ribosome maturation factor RimM [Hahella sp. CCB-MM4]